MTQLQAQRRGQALTDLWRDLLGRLGELERQDMLTAREDTIRLTLERFMTMVEDERVRVGKIANRRTMEDYCNVGHDATVSANQLVSPQDVLQKGD